MTSSSSDPFAAGISASLLSSLDVNCDFCKLTFPSNKIIKDEIECRCPHCDWVFPINCFSCAKCESSRPILTTSVECYDCSLLRYKCEICKNFFHGSIVYYYPKNPPSKQHICTHCRESEEEKKLLALNDLCCKFCKKNLKSLDIIRIEVSGRCQRCSAPFNSDEIIICSQCLPNYKVGINYCDRCRPTF